jgi:hypothetical protein
VPRRESLHGESEGRRPKAEQRQGDEQPHAVVGSAPEDEECNYSAHCSEEDVHRDGVGREGVEGEAEIFQSVQTEGGELPGRARDGGAWDMQ